MPLGRKKIKKNDNKNSGNYVSACIVNFSTFCAARRQRKNYVKPGDPVKTVAVCIYVNAVGII